MATYQSIFQFSKESRGFPRSILLYVWTCKCKSRTDSRRLLVICQMEAKARAGSGHDKQTLRQLGSGKFIVFRVFQTTGLSESHWAWNDLNSSGWGVELISYADKVDSVGNGWQRNVDSVLVCRELNTKGFSSICFLPDLGGHSLRHVTVTSGLPSGWEQRNKKEDLDLSVEWLLHIHRLRGLHLHTELGKTLQSGRSGHVS